MKINKYWYLWQKAIGERASDNDQVSDHVAVIRTVLVLSYLVTNIVICLGVIHHW